MVLTITMHGNYLGTLRQQREYYTGMRTGEKIMMFG